MDFGKKKIILSVVGVVVGLLVLSAGLYYYQSKKSIISEGDSIDYQAEITATGYGTFSGGVTYEVTDVSEDRLIVSITPTGDLSSFWDKQSKRIERGENEELKKGEYLGLEAISTPMGTFEVEHYRYENQITYQTENGFAQGVKITHNYYETKTEMPVKMKITSPKGYSMELVISDTTIETIEDQVV